VVEYKTKVWFIDNLIEWKDIKCLLLSLNAFKYLRHLHCNLILVNFRYRYVTLMIRFQLSPSYTRVYRGLGVDRKLESMHTKCTEEWRASFRTVPTRWLSNLTSKKHFFFINVKYVGLLRMHLYPRLILFESTEILVIQVVWSISILVIPPAHVVIHLNFHIENLLRFPWRFLCTRQYFTYHFAVDIFSQPAGNYLCIVFLFFCVSMGCII